MFLFGAVGFSQTVLKKGEDHSYKGYVSTIVVSDDPSGYMKSFEIGIQWTTFMGEPVENYAFSWEANDRFKAKVDGKTVTISKYELDKYPDLVKELEAVKPSRADVVLYGKAKGGSASVRPGSLPNEPRLFVQNGGSVKKSGQSYRVYNLLGTFVYEVSDSNLLFGTSGKKIAGSIVGGSPNWNNFIQWRDKQTYLGGVSSVADYHVLNYSPAEYGNLSADEKENADRRFKNIYKIVDELEVRASLKTLEWGYQLESIAREYLKREKKEEEEEEEEEEESEKDEDDFWSDEDTVGEDDSDFWDSDGEHQEVTDDDFWSSDRLQVDVIAPRNGSTSQTNVIDFAAKYNIQSDGFTGVVLYNGIEQQLLPSDGQFRGKLVLKAGTNNIRFQIRHGETILNDQQVVVNYTGKPVKLRSTLTWNGHADIDLHLTHPNNGHCYHGNKNTGLAVLDVDNTQAYGPENISVEHMISGEYTISVVNYSNTPGIKATIYIFLDERLHTTKDIYFDHQREVVVERINH